jgi:signal transduction histidine kinase
MYQPIMERRRQHFALRMPSQSIMVTGDLMRLVQIFSNLLDNASKYTPNGGQIGLTAQTHGRSVSIVVADSGRGIGDQAMPFIFDLYTQGPSVSDAEHRGSGFGIGLYVVQRLVAAHRGHIVARSHGQDLGSEFVVTLPLHGDEARSDRGD